MRARIYHSSNEIFKFALEDIYRQFLDDFAIDSFDFIIVAIDSKYNYEDINFSIKKVFNTNNFVAFNAVDAFAKDEIIENGVIALFIKFEKNGKIDTYYQDNFEVNENLIEYLQKHNNDLNIILSYPSDDIPKFIEELNKKLGDNDISLLGGLCSGYLDSEELVAYQYIDGKIIKNGVVLISFENCEFFKEVSLGYKAIGPHYKVQVVKGNRVYVIDYQDASLITKNLLKNIDNSSIQILWFSPLVILNEKDGEIDIVRTFKSIKDGEYVEFFGPIERDSLVKLSFATEDMLLKSNRKKAALIKENLKNIELGFNFSCIARQYSLGKKQVDEVKEYAKIFNAPIFGFFTFGEIDKSRVSNKIKFYNQTSLVCGIKEK